MFASLSLIYLSFFIKEELFLCCVLFFWFLRLLFLGGLLNITNALEGRFDEESKGAGGGGEDIKKLSSLLPTLLIGEPRNVPLEYLDMI